MVNLESAGGGHGPADRAASGSLVYLDHAATTPMLPEALAAMTEELAHTGNPSSLHNAGRRARRVVEESREQLAQAFGARPSEVVFTSGGTEADNLAVKGLFWARQGSTRPRRRILATAIEHHAVLDSVHWLADHQGAQVEWLSVDQAGLLDPEVLREAIERDPGNVALVSVMWANNEVGTIQPVAELAAVASEHGIPFHSDAVQAAGQLQVDLAASGATALTVTGHKLGGPVGAGALLLVRGEDPVPVLHGGGQERDVRSGTLDAAAIRAFAVAVETATAGKDGHAARLRRLRDGLIERVRAAVPDAILNGPPPGEHRLPGNAHFSFPGCEGDALLMLLDARGVACSTGSACTAGVAEPSHVLLAMGADHARARGSLRFSLGWTSMEADVNALGAALGEVVERARRAGRQAGLYTARAAAAQLAAQPDGQPGIATRTRVAGQAAAP
jgi:cysteine desulfurase